MKKIYVFVPVFLIAVLIITAVTPAITMSERISENVFRLHIIANSDSDADQHLKLKVRDEVLKLSKELFVDCESVDDAISASRENLALIKKTAQKTISLNGFTEEARVFVTKEYFNTRHYEGFTLPAGEYNSLKIEIGEGKGHNWWCVMFPSVCITGCTSDFDGTLTDEEQKMIESDKYVVRFKFVEVYEKIKSMI